MVVSWCARTAGAVGSAGGGTCLIAFISLARSSAIQEEAERQVTRWCGFRALGLEWPFLFSLTVANGGHRELQVRVDWKWPFQNRTELH